MTNRNSSQDDLYSLNRGTYKITNIYGLSTDGKGHQVHKRVNFPPALMNAINYVHKGLGYTTPESFIRDAAVHRLHFWQEAEGCPPDAVGMIALAEAEAMFDDYQAMRRSIQKLQSDIPQTTGEMRRRMLVRVVILRDNLPDHLSDFHDELDRLVKTFE